MHNNETLSSGHIPHKVFLLASPYLSFRNSPGGKVRMIRMFPPSFCLKYSIYFGYIDYHVGT